MRTKNGPGQTHGFDQAANGIDCVQAVLASRSSSEASSSCESASSLATGSMEPGVASGSAGFDGHDVVVHTLGPQDRGLLRFGGSLPGGACPAGNTSSKAGTTASQSSR